MWLSRGGAGEKSENATATGFETLNSSAERILLFHVDIHKAQRAPRTDHIFSKLISENVASINISYSYTFLFSGIFLWWSEERFWGRKSEEVERM